MSGSQRPRPHDGPRRAVSQASPIVRTGAEWVFHTALLFSVFLLLVGHRAPGGGFAGGLVAGTAFVLRYLSSGPQGPRSAVRLAPSVLLGLGLSLAAGTGTVPLAAGKPLLSSATWHSRLPLIGEVELSSALLFDAGIYLIVVAVVLMVLQTVGRAEDPQR